MSVYRVWPLWASIGAHAAAIVTTGTMAALAPAAPPARDLIPIEMVRVEPPPTPPPPPERPKVVRRILEKIVAPRLVTKPQELAQPLPAPAPLLDDRPRRENVQVATEQPDASWQFFAGATDSSAWSMPGASGGNKGKSGALFSTGDLPIPGAAGGSGSGGGNGAGGGVGVASTGDTKGITSFARPLGGYQTRPRYPDSARRQGIEGETLLRFQVLTSGRVASVSVARSAGHPDLDRAAMDAVKSWLFEPARRGKDAVNVWVMLPIRFQLHSGIGE